MVAQSKPTMMAGGIGIHATTEPQKMGAGKPNGVVSDSTMATFGGRGKIDCCTVSAFQKQGKSLDRKNCLSWIFFKNLAGHFRLGLMIFRWKQIIRIRLASFAHDKTATQATTCSPLWHDIPITMNAP
jgi:hypothetical protein